MHKVIRDVGSAKNLALALLIAWSAQGVSAEVITEVETVPVWKQTLQALDRYAQLGYQLKENRKATRQAVTHHRVLSENLQMNVSPDFIHQIRSLRQYTDWKVSNKLSVGVGVIKSRPLGPKETRILQNMMHFTTTLDNKDFSRKGYGLEFSYQLD